MQTLYYDERGKHWEELTREAGMEVVVRKDPTCGRNDDCGWGSVGLVLLVGAPVVPNWTVHWRCLWGKYCRDLGQRQNERAEIGI